MTLIPGVDPNGEPWRMSFFHAFYFVSFMGTTIGFGEIPYPFTDTQRAWVLVCIYTSVISWLYGIGTLLRLLQDETFRNAVSQRAFKLSIKRLHRPFYIICGYGETGQLISRGLADLDLKSVIIDRDSERTHMIELEDLRTVPIVLTADITEPQNLVAAGINHAHCKGIIAVTQDDHTNLKIAVASKLVNPRVPVICRSEIEDEANNMASFGTDAIINPYTTFGRRLKLLTQNPELHRIHNWFINQHSSTYIDSKISENGLPAGKWVICGYGRFGKAVKDYTGGDAIDTVIVDVDPIASKAPVGTIVGRGTEAQTLIDAGIEDAVVVVAASDDDANNLSILITARQLNPKLVTIGRVSREPNHQLFIHAKCDYIMRRDQIVASEVLTTISRPLVVKFLQYSSSLSPEDTEVLVKQICLVAHNEDPITWRLIIDEKNAPALVRFLNTERSLKVGDISSNPTFPNSDSIPLLLLRGGMSHLLPTNDMHLKLGDQLLFCGRRDETLLAQHMRDNVELVDTLINKNPHDIPLLRWLRRRRQS